MPIETISGTDVRYYLIPYDKHGRERRDDPDGLLSRIVRDSVARERVTDVFFMSHGWKGDVPAAREQYTAWTGAMLQCHADREKIRGSRPDFQPLLVGLHWPSLPWGDEDLAAGANSFSLADNPIDDWLDDAADKTADTPRARQALNTIFAAALDDIAPPELSDELAEAYRTLYAEIGISAGGPGASPGGDIEVFDPESVYQQSLDEAAISFGVSDIGGGVLAVLRQLSFWTMKARARTIGETGAAALLRDLQQAAAGRQVRFHTMGHSFGCIVISAAIAGAGADAALLKPVDTAFLAQGALSLWAYCSDIPVARGKAGYFHAIARDGRVAGPVIITQSEHDTAVGKLYPIGAGLRRQVDFAPGELPKYGGLGAFGARGPGIDCIDLDMQPLAGDYHYQKARFYNLESSAYINRGEGLSGAHSDIAKAEVAHAFWQAVMTA